jgi:AraC family transcriptional regulator
METRYEAMVRRTVVEIERSLDDPPGFRELADRAHLSPYHFHRIFRAMIGESPKEFVRRLRLERSAHRLRGTARSITDIAVEAGYESPQAFAKAFQAEYEATPSAYRADGGRGPHLESPSRVHFVDGGFTSCYLVVRGGTEMKVGVVDLPAQRVAAVRHVGPYWQIGKAFDELADHVGRLGPVPGADTVAVFYDDPDTVAEQDLRSIAGVIVPGDADIGDLEESSLPGGRYLRAEFIGEYAGLPEAWRTLYSTHIPSGGHELRDGVCFEVYVTRHGEVGPEQMRTDLYVPVA